MNDKFSTFEIANCWNALSEKGAYRVFSSSLLKQGVVAIDYFVGGAANSGMKGLLNNNVCDLPDVMQSISGNDIGFLVENKLIYSAEWCDVSKKIKNLYPNWFYDNLLYAGKIYDIPINFQQTNLIWLNLELLSDYNKEGSVSWCELIEKESYSKKPMAISREPWHRYLIFENIILSLIDVDTLKTGDSLNIDLIPKDVIYESISILNDIINMNKIFFDTWIDSIESVISGESSCCIMGDWAINIFKYHTEIIDEVKFSVCSSPASDEFYNNVSDSFVFPLKPSDTICREKFISLLFSPEVMQKFYREKGCIGIFDFSSEQKNDGITNNLINNFKNNLVVSSNAFSNFKFSRNKSLINDFFDKKITPDKLYSSLINFS